MGSAPGNGAVPLQRACGPPASKDSTWGFYATAAVWRHLGQPSGLEPPQALSLSSSRFRPHFCGLSVTFVKRGNQKEMSYQGKGQAALAAHAALLLWDLSLLLQPHAQRTRAHKHSLPKHVPLLPARSQPTPCLPPSHITTHPLDQQQQQQLQHNMLHSLQRGMGGGTARYK